MSPTTILKADGTTEPFSTDKFVSSLTRAGASKKAIDDVLKRVQDDLLEGMTTYNIYKHAFSLLRGIERHAAARYSLRRALEALGPSGFPFESYMAELFKSRGFDTKIRQNLLGTCVQHEVDVVAWNENKLLMVESKFHNQQGIKTDLKVVLYVKARFDDLSEQLFDYGKKRSLDEGWLVTNTKFTTHAIQYANCANVRLLGWNYPERGNLQDLIVEYGLHPITCLSGLSHSDQTTLLSKDIVLCKDVIGKREQIEELGIHGNAYEQLAEEARAVCSIGTT